VKNRESFTEQQCVKELLNEWERRCAPLAGFLLLPEDIIGFSQIVDDAHEILQAFEFIKRELSKRKGATSEEKVMLILKNDLHCIADKKINAALQEVQTRGIYKHPVTCASKNEVVDVNWPPLGARRFSGNL